MAVGLLPFLSEHQGEFFDGSICLLSHSPQREDEWSESTLVYLENSFSILIPFLMVNASIEVAQVSGQIA